MHGVAIQHTRLANREITDIDHFLNFSITFSLDFAHLQADQAAQCILVLAQCFGAQANGVTTLRCRYLSPFLEYFSRVGDEFFVVVRRGSIHTGDHFSG